jgi:hypothetical protein
MRWRVAGGGGGDASSCLLLLALAVAGSDGGNERVVEREERVLSMIDANVLSCPKYPHNVGRESVVAVCCVCVCISSALEALNQLVVPAPSAVTRANSSPNCAFPILSNLGALSI